LDELGDDHELTITVAQFREFYQSAKTEAELIDRQLAWVNHWIDDVKAGLKPTLHSLKRCRAALAASRGE
jgi:hypothetical protein